MFLFFSKRFCCSTKMILFVGIADCCSSDNNLAVDNAFVSCSTIVSCKAKCYGGYIFSSGSTEEDYNCQNGVWIPMSSSCKRMLLNFSMVLFIRMINLFLIICKCDKFIMFNTISNEVSRRLICAFQNFHVYFSWNRLINQRIFDNLSHLFNVM